MRISSLGKNRNIARRKGGLQGDDKVAKKDCTGQTGEKGMEYFMMPAQKVPLQHFRKTEKDVIGGLCRWVLAVNCTIFQNRLLLID